MSRLLSPAQVGGLTLKNRLAMSPMCMYEVKKENGIPTPFHFAHYGARAIAGVGLIILEATAVQPEGRITPHDLGLWNDQQMEALKQLVDHLHYLGAKVGIPLQHAGRKATGLGKALAPSALSYDEKDPNYLPPQEMSLEDIQTTQAAFAAAANRARQAGFDVVELHGAHGYLLHQFLEPANNHRTDPYGGSLENRYRMLGETLQVVTSAFQDPVWIRLSASAYLPEGEQNSLSDYAQIAQWIEREGAQLLEISTGGLVPVLPNIPLHQGYQVSFAKALKTVVSMDVATVGLLDNPGLCEFILADGQADLILQGRALLRNTNWLADAARLLHDKDWKPYNHSYLRGQGR